MMKLLLGLLGYLSSVQLLSRVQLFATPWTAARQASLSITNSWSLPKLMSIELVILSISCVFTFLSKKGGCVLVLQGILVLSFVMCGS